MTEFERFFHKPTKMHKSFNPAMTKLICVSGHGFQKSYFFAKTLIFRAFSEKTLTSSLNVFRISQRKLPAGKIRRNCSGVVKTGNSLPPRISSAWQTIRTDCSCYLYSFLEQSYIEYSRGDPRRDRTEGRSITKLIEQPIRENWNEQRKLSGLTTLCPPLPLSRLNFCRTFCCVMTKNLRPVNVGL